MYMSFWMAFIILCMIGLWSTEKLSLRALYFFYFIIILYGSVLIALRPDTVPDFLAYKHAYEIADLQYFQGFHPLSREPKTGMEYGFLYFIIGFKMLFSCNFRVLLFLLSFITILVSTQSMSEIVKSLHRRDDIFMQEKYYTEILIVITVLYFSYLGLLYQGIAIRSAIAMTFSVLAVKNTIQKKYLSFVADILAAFMFHRMAIVIALLVFAFLFIPQAKNKRPYIVAFLSVTIAITVMIMTGAYALFSGILFRASSGILGYGSYIKGAAGAGRIGVRLILISFISVFFSYSDRTLYKLMNIFLCGVIIATIFAGIGGAERLYDYFFMFYIPVLAVEMCNKQNRAIVIFAVMFIVVINYYISFSIWGVL